MCGKYQKLDLLKGFKTPPTWDIVGPEVDVDMADADHTPQVHSPFSCGLFIFRDRTLTSLATVSVQTVHSVLTYEIYV